MVNLTLSLPGYESGGGVHPLNLRNPLTIEEVAAVANLNPGQFSCAFLAETGRSPARAVERLRVEAARFMIEEGRKGDVTGVPDWIWFRLGVHLIFEVDTRWRRKTELENGVEREASTSASVLSRRLSPVAPLLRQSRGAMG